MKLKNVFLLSLSAVALAACSDDENAATGGGLNAGSKGEMSVTLKFNGGLVTKAYAEGTLEESRVRDAEFYYFKASDGSYLGTSGELTDLGQVTTGGNTERQLNVPVPADAVHALQDATAQVKVIAVLNKDKDSFTAPQASTTYDAFRSAALTRTLTDSYDEKGKMSFMMTNAVYAKTDALTGHANVAAFKSDIQDDITITSANVYEEGRKPNGYSAVDIYVERACSKVPLKDERVNTTDGPDNIDFQLKGWGLTVLNTKYYPVKNLKGTFDAPATGDPYDFTTLWATAEWNKAADYRSFWAVDPNYDGTDTYVGTDFKNVEFSTLTKQPGGAYYCLENTFSNQGQNRDETTSVALLVQFAPTTFADGGTTPTDADYAIIRYNNTYYTSTGFLNTVMGADNQTLVNKKYYKKTSDNPLTYESLGTSDFVLKAKGDAVQVTLADGNAKTVGYVNGMEIALAEGIDALYTTTDPADNTKFTEVAEGDRTNALAELTSVGQFTAFANGFCYYVVPIRHFTDSEVDLGDVVNDNTQIGRYGIVRNHVYDLSVNTITNVGDPITGTTVVPDDENVPDDQTSYFLDVRVNVLSWAVRTQQLDL